MNRTFWITFGVLTVALFGSVVLAWRIEETRWQSTLDSVKIVVQSARESDEKTAQFIVALRQLGEDKKVKEMENREAQRAELRKQVMDMLDQRPMLWETIPFNWTHFHQERKTQLLGWVFLALGILYAFLFVVAFISRTSKESTKVFMDETGKVKDYLLRLGNVNDEKRSVEIARAHQEKRSRELDEFSRQIAAERLIIQREREEFEVECEELDAQEAWIRQQAEQARKDLHQATLLLEEAARSDGVSKNSEATLPVLAQARPQLVASGEKSWQFSMTFDVARKAVGLPSDPEGFVEALGLMMREVRYQDLDPRTVYDKLVTIMGRDLYQRSRMKKITYDNSDLRDWTWARVGKHRLYLIIEESERHMTLHLRPRDDAYISARRPRNK